MSECVCGNLKCEGQFTYIVNSRKQGSGDVFVMPFVQDAGLPISCGLEHT